MKILCFIFSWKGQFEKAKQLEKQLSPFVDTYVVNSEDENTPDKWINIGNECYFSDQFRTALGLFDDSKYDCFLHIQADASYDKDWENIILEAQLASEKYNWGVYAPNVDDTFYIPSRTDIFSLENNLKVVATTDNTCWFIHKDIIREMKTNLDLMKNNKLGWGWDLLVCAFSHLSGRKVIRDYNFTINHPPSTGYLKDEAEQEMMDMFNLLEGKLQETVYFIKMYPKKLSSLYNIPEEINQEQNNLFIFDTESVLK